MSIKHKFASGGFRDAFETTALSGNLQGKYGLKKYRSDQLPKIEELFGSMEIHIRKAVQMHCLARNFVNSLENECPLEYGDTFKFNKVYYGKMGSECITIERFLDGEFVKYINNILVMMVVRLFRKQKHLFIILPTSHQSN